MLEFLPFSELYENKDPILPSEVEVPMIRDEETGKLRKKTLHERYTKQRRHNDAEVRINMNSSRKKFDDMSSEELENEVRRQRKS